MAAEGTDIVMNTVANEPAVEEATQWLEKDHIPMIAREVVNGVGELLTARIRT